MKLFVESASTLITKFLQSGHSVGRQVATATAATADKAVTAVQTENSSHDDAA